MSSLTSRDSEIWLIGVSVVTSSKTLASISVISRSLTVAAA